MFVVSENFDFSIQTEGWSEVHSRLEAQVQELIGSVFLPQYNVFVLVFCYCCEWSAHSTKFPIAQSFTESVILFVEI